MRISPPGIVSVPPTKVRVGNAIETPRFPPKRTTWKTSNSFFALQSVTLDRKGPGFDGVGFSVESRTPASVDAPSTGVLPRRTSKQQSLKLPPRRTAQWAAIVVEIEQTTIVPTTDRTRPPAGCTPHSRAAGNGRVAGPS